MLGVLNLDALASTDRDGCSHILQESRGAKLYIASCRMEDYRQ